MACDYIVATPLEMVNAACRASGFTRLSAFSSAYKTRFGEAPLATLARHRQRFKRWDDSRINGKPARGMSTSLNTWKPLMVAGAVAVSSVRSRRVFAAHAVVDMEEVGGIVGLLDREKPRIVFAPLRLLPVFEEVVGFG